MTPFKNGEIDESAFTSLVEWQIDQGTHGLVPCGTTGESPTLSHDEHEHVVELCVKAARGRVPVIAGTGSNSTDEAIRLTRHAAAVGAAGALVVTPYYNKPNQDGLVAHYRALNECADLPIIIYNIPSRSAVDMTVETMAGLAKLPNVAGVKDATGDVTRVTRLRMAAGEEFIQLSGEDGSAVGFMVHGGHGCISVTANVAPALCAQFQNACLEGDYGRALELHERLMPLHINLFEDTSPAPVKYAASELGLCANELRLPLQPVGPRVEGLVHQAMREAGLL